MRALVERSVPLRALELANVKLRCRGVATLLGELSRMPSLTLLDLSSNPLTVKEAAPRDPSGGDNPMEPTEGDEPPRGAPLPLHACSRPFPPSRQPAVALGTAGASRALSVEALPWSPMISHDLP